MKTTRALKTFLSLALLCNGCGDSAVGGREAAPDHILIIVDLSTSLTKDQRLLIPGLVAGLVINQGKNAVVSVYPLVSDMGHAAPLVPGIRPPKTGRLVDVTDWQRYVQNEWAQALMAKVHEVVKLPKAEQDQTYTSCYIASAIYANQYFRTVASAGRRRLVWVGDLIEDCGLREFRQYRAPDSKGALRNVGNLSLGLEQLSGVDVVCAIVPRELSAGPSDISFRATVDYWDVLKVRLGMTPEKFRIDAAGAVLPPAVRVSASAPPSN